MQPFGRRWRVLDANREIFSVGTLLPAQSQSWREEPLSPCGYGM